MTPAERAAFIASQRAYLSSANNQPQLALDEFFSPDSAAPTATANAVEQTPVAPAQPTTVDDDGRIDNKSIDDDIFTPAASATSAKPMAATEQPAAPDFGLLSSALDGWRAQAVATPSEPEPESAGETAKAAEIAADAVAAEPEMAEPAFANPAFANPELAKPEFSKSEFTKSELAKPVAAEPIAVEPAMAKSITAEPVTTKPAVAEPVVEPVIESAAEPVIEPAAEPETDAMPAVSASAEPDDLNEVELPPWYAQNRQPDTEPGERFDDDAGLDDVAAELAPASKSALSKARTNQIDTDKAVAPPQQPEATPPADPVTPATPVSGTPSDWLHAGQNKPADNDWDDEDFVLHVDPDAIAGTHAVVGDWHMDQSNTVAAADDRDVLNRLAAELESPPERQPESPPKRPAETPAGARPLSAESRLAATAHSIKQVQDARRREPQIDAGEQDPDAIIAADFGDVGSDWDKPSVQLRDAKTTPAAPVQVEPFDADSFTADSDGRIYGTDDAMTEPLLDDPFGGLGSNTDWTLAPTEPREDYENLRPRKRRLPWAGLLWTLAALVLLTLVISQFLWPQRGVLREDPQWGPWVEQVCAHIDCELPPRVDLTKIRLQQKSVLKDRADPRKLQIDLLVSNTAEFAQAYPDIRLRFTNIEGEMVAERRFKPEEYLRERPEAALMPSNIPIHIAFAVKAPDGNITGYEFEFLPPQQP